MTLDLHQGSRLVIVSTLGYWRRFAISSNSTVPAPGAEPVAPWVALRHPARAA